MSSSEALATKPGNEIAVAGGEELAVRGTPRGKVQLSLADLEAKVSHYPKEIREVTIAAQIFFVEHCSSNIDMFTGVARNTLKHERSPEYFNNWLKGHYFRGGGGQVRGKGYSDWLEFCNRVAEHHRAIRTGGDTIVTGTVRAIEEKIREVYDVTNPCRIGGVSGPTGSQKTEGIL
ncbi:MAG TPA: hypothetical protein VD970_08005, partial [Acetobacteraceae bacterium]|nr:hypothetical protein [Acetobacteraceae bacterium]